MYAGMYYGPDLLTLEAQEIVKHYIDARVIFFGASKEESPADNANSESTSIAIMHCPW